MLYNREYKVCREAVRNKKIFYKIEFIMHIMVIGTNRVRPEYQGFNSIQLKKKRGKTKKTNTLSGKSWFSVYWGNKFII